MVFTNLLPGKLLGGIPFPSMVNFKVSGSLSLIRKVVLWASDHELSFSALYPLTDFYLYFKTLLSSLKSFLLVPLRMYRGSTFSRVYRKQKCSPHVQDNTKTSGYVVYIPSRPSTLSRRRLRHTNFTHQQC